jgi:hypothetical protein
LNNLEEWKDYRFAELEAEVAAEGQRLWLGFIPLFESRNTLRRERSLSKALKKSRARLILVEGDPGSGKSVALRHVAQEMAARAMRSRNVKSLIPIYINLKELERPKKTKVDRNLIQAFILKTLNRINDRDIDEFLEEEFDAGAKEGTWFFLFDSFDEIPEILSSTEADHAIQQYSEAISDFLHGLNSCRGVLASRYFRGPKQFGWPRFRILPLSEERRSELVRKAGLKVETEKELLGRLHSAEQEMRAMAGNPMFLSLLCAHMRGGNPFPENAHSVFENYISSRLDRDAGRLKRQFDLGVREVRATAELVAFCMAADKDLGLSPSRDKIREAALQLHISLPKSLDKELNALEYIKLARSETANVIGESRQFTFAHRRFQEYFATSVVLRAPERVTPSQLLLDARWRETAVVICQTQETEVLTPVIEEAEKILLDLTTGLTPAQSRKPDAPFSWPLKIFHVLSLLQDGFARRLKLLPASLCQRAGRVLTRGSEKGSLGDKKSALDVAGVIPKKMLTDLIRDAFRGRSAWLRESAFKQVARLGNMPEDIAQHIQGTIILMFVDGRLHKDRLAIHAHLSRLHQAKFFLSLLDALVWLPLIDLLAHVSSFLIVLLVMPGNFTDRFNDSWFAFSLIVYTTLFIVSYFSLRLISLIMISTRTTALFQFLKSAGFVLLLRSTLLFSLNLIALKTRGHFWLPSRPLRFILFYLLIWAPSTLIIVSTRHKAISRVLLPFTPFLCLLAALKRFVLFVYRESKKLLSRKPREEIMGQLADFSKSLKHFRSKWKDDLLILLIFFGIIGLFGLLSAGIIAFLSLLPGIAVPTLVAIAAIFVIYLSVPVFNDVLTWYRWKKKVRQLTAEEFVASTSHYFTGIFKLRFITHVRVENLIRNTEEATALIEQLGWRLERDRPSEFFSVFILETEGIGSKNPTRFARYLKYAAFAAKAKMFVRDDEILDEVYRLLEQLKASAA